VKASVVTRKMLPARLWKERRGITYGASSRPLRF
jgi:hypothetical protein